MARKEGLRPIGESVKKIIEKIQKERRERLKKGKPIRTQPKLPGLKKGGDVQKMMSGGFGIFSKKKAKADEPDKKESNETKKKKRLKELQKEIDGMRQGGSAKKPIKVKKIAIGVGKAKDYPGIRKIIEMNKKGKKRFRDGGSALKPVDKSKNPGLAKLPTKVRNKMGFMKKGGKVK